jgi:hypothetical protein
LIGLIISSVFFVGYCWYQVKESNDARSLEQAFLVKQKLMANGSNVWVAFKEEFDLLVQNPDFKKLIKDPHFCENADILAVEAMDYGDCEGTPDDALMRQVTGSHTLHKPLWKNALMRQMRHMFDEMNTGDSSSKDKYGEADTLDPVEIGIYFSKFNDVDTEVVKALFFQFDKNRSGTINFPEFVLFVVEYHKLLNGYEPTPDSDSDDEEEDLRESQKQEKDARKAADLEGFQRVASNLKKSPESNSHESTVLKSALKTLTIGSVIILLFSDPMCAVLNEIGSRTGIPAFYISFVVAPLASNGSEIIVAYNFAARKTKQSVSASFNTLLGAACMNNTFCLGIFMAIIAFSKKEKNIYWEYAAETFVILLAECCMFYFALRQTHRMRDGYIVLILYPLTIGLVALFKYGIKLN